MNMHTTVLSLSVVVAIHPALEGTERAHQEQNRQDRQYMVDLVARKGQGPITIDLTDSRQYRFVIHRLSEAGKTVDNSPYFFQRISELSALTGAKADHSNQETQLSGDPNFSRSDHFPLNLVNIGDLDFEATAFTTVQGGTAFTYIDVAAWDEDGVQVSNLGWNEEYAAGTAVIATSYGSFSEDSERLRIGSLQMYETIDGEVKLTYTSQWSGSPAINLSEPMRSTGGERDAIYVCLNRDYSDCDYTSMAAIVLRLPFSGSFRLSEAYRFSTFLPGSTLKLCGIGGFASGGIAKFRSDSPIESFFTHRIEGTDEFIDWSLPPGAGHFGDGMLSHFYRVNWFLKIQMRLTYPIPNTPPVEFTADINTYLMGYPVEITGNPLLPLSFQYSCLAAGTGILLPDGTKKAVEAVEYGQPVRSENGVLTVVDTSVGIEQLPMIRIWDERGRTLLLTEGHPLIGAEGQIHLAAELIVGQMLNTSDGPSRLVTVKREQYAGHVFNLKLGTPQELAAMPVASNTLYANGYLVGDLVMQNEQQTKKSAEKDPLLTRLPLAWHQDFFNSQKNPERHPTAREN